MAEALCLRSISAPATSLSFARRCYSYHRHRYYAPSISRSPSSALLLQANHAGGSRGSPSRSQDVCSKRKAFHGRESRHIHIAPSFRPPTSLRGRSCDGARDVVFAACFSSSSLSSSMATFGPSRIGGSPFRTSMHTECGAASTIPTYDEENLVEKVAHSIREPPILKRGMEIPQKWNIPGGTVVLMDKPKGWTSFAVCAKIRKLVQVKKVGHAGTLDPMATGLLVVCVGPATKLADSFQALVKVYTGTFRLGEATSSCDADSPVIETKAWEHISDADIQIVKEKFVGEIMQIPPMFSAIKVEGERLYEKARRGEQIDVPARKIIIYDFQIERNKEDRQLLDFYVRCSKGTYIRSLCADVGRALDSCAHLTKLRREKIGDFSVDDAWQFQDLAEMYSTLYSA